MTLVGVRTPQAVGRIATECELDSIRPRAFPNITFVFLDALPFKSKVAVETISYKQSVFCVKNNQRR